MSGVDSSAVAAQGQGQGLLQLEVTLFMCRGNATVDSPECERQVGCGGNVGQMGYTLTCLGQQMERWLRPCPAMLGIACVGAGPPACVPVCLPCPPEGRQPAPPPLKITLEQPPSPPSAPARLVGFCRVSRCTLRAGAEGRPEPGAGICRGAAAVGSGRWAEQSGG